MNGKFGSLILVSENSQITQAFKLYNKLSLSGKRPLILTGYEIDIQNKKYSVRNLSYYQEIFKIDYSQIKQAANSLFYSLAEQKLSKGAALRQLTCYKDVSLWDLSARYIFSDLIPILYYISIGEAILDYQRPQEVFAIDDKGELEKIFCLLCSEKHINFNVKPKKHILIFELKRVFKKCLIFIKKIKRLFVSVFFLLLNLLKSCKLNKTYKVLFFAPVERFLLSMLPVILKYNDDERLVINTFVFEPAKKLKENKVFYTNFYGYKLYSLFDWKVRDFLKKIKDEIYNDKAFFAKILYKELPIGSLLANIFEGLIYEEFPEKIREIDIVRKIVLSYRPKVVVVSDCCFNIALIAKSISISVVGMQSIHPEDFIRFSPVIADAVTVDGNSWKEYLSEYFDSTKIWVTGPPKFEILQNNKFATKEKFSLVGNFYETKKIVIFATNYSSLWMASIKYQNIERLRSVCGAVKNIKDAYLIIKLHPYDYDWSTYRKIVKETGLLNYSIVKNVEMLKLLSNCDLLITHFSAVGYEAVLMDKNVISLCCSSDLFSEDAWNFRRYSAVMVVDKLAELESCIRNALFDSRTISTLKKNRQAYIYEHAYKLDGNASGRVKEVIDLFCNNKIVRRYNYN